MDRASIEAIRDNALSMQTRGYPIVRIEASELIALADLALLASSSFKTRTVLTTAQLRERLKISESARQRYMEGMLPIAREGKQFLWTESQAAEVRRELERSNKID